MTQAPRPRVTALQPRSPSRTVEAAGDRYRYLATGASTNGTYFMMEAVVPPGGGPAPHIQTREDEGFYVLEGTVTFWSDDREISAGPGTFVNVPRGALHNFRNETDQMARMLIWFAPAGIEEMFDRMHANPDAMAEIAAEYGVHFPDPT